MASRPSCAFPHGRATEGSIAADAVKLQLLTARPASGLEAQAEGWVATARGLSSTADGGVSWEAVSPPGIAPSQIRGIRIAGPKGWLVAATGIRKTPIALYSTVDRGRTWTSSTLPVPVDVDVAAPADVVAVDTQLVVGLRLQPNRFGLTRGVLLKSLDGLKWKQLPLPTGGRLAFPTTKDGWLVGGLAKEQLFATHDSGKTWRAVRPPPAITGAASTVYALPTFSSATDGVLPVSLAAGTRSALAFMTTVDGGRSWTKAATVKLGKSLTFGSGAPSAVVAPDYWLAAVGTRLVAVTDGGLARKTVGTLPGTVTGLQFTSATTGWAQVAGERAQALLDDRRRRDLDAAQAAVELLPPLARVALDPQDAHQLAPQHLGSNYAPPGLPAGDRGSRPGSRRARARSRRTSIRVTGSST